MHFQIWIYQTCHHQPSTGEQIRALNYYTEVSSNLVKAISSSGYIRFIAITKIRRSAVIQTLMLLLLALCWRTVTSSWTRCTPNWSRTCSWSAPRASTTNCRTEFLTPSHSCLMPASGSGSSLETSKVYFYTLPVLCTTLCDIFALKTNTLQYFSQFCSGYCQDCICSSFQLFWLQWW